MAEVNLDDLKLEDLLFIVGGSIFQGSTADDIELEVFPPNHLTVCGMYAGCMTILP